MKHLSIYSAGKMSGLSFDRMNRWRENLKENLVTTSQWEDCIIDFCNPVDYYNFEIQRHQSEKEVMDFDLAKVLHSDIIVVNLDGLDTSDGTKIEIYTAWQNKIPVFVVGKRELYNSLHPWIKRCVTRYEENNDTLCEYIRDFYMR